MKNTTNKLTRTIAASVAAIMMLTAASSLSAFADNTQAVTQMNTAAAINAALNTTAGEQLDESAKKLSKAIMNSGIDYFANCVPGGSAVSTPLKKLVEYIYGDQTEQDPIQDLIKQEQAHFEQLSNMIQTLDKNMAMYADMLSKKIDTATGVQTLGQVFMDLSANLCDLIDRVDSIVEDEHYTPEQKLILLADLNNANQRGEQYLIKVRQDCDTLSKTMNYNGEVLTVDFYGTLMEVAKPGVLYYDEAFRKAEGYAQQLTKQYMLANYILTICQNATLALNFTEEEAEKICTTEELKKAYANCSDSVEQTFQTKKLTQTFDRMTIGIESFKAFDDQRENADRRFIDGGRKDDHLAVMIPDCTISSASFRLHYDKYNYYKDNILDVADYIRRIREPVFGTDTPRKLTFRQFMTQRGHNMIDLGRQYIVISDKITDTRGERNGSTQSIIYHADGSFDVITIPLYNYTSTIKAIDVDDPELNIIDLPVKTYRADNKNTNQCDVREISNKYFFFKACDPDAKPDIHGPTI